MRKTQIIIISLATVLVLALFFGFDTKSSVQKEDLEKRLLSGTEIDIGSVVVTAKESLAVDDLKVIEDLERTIGLENLPIQDRISNLKELSGKWYRLKAFLLAGHYAETIANSEESAQAWSIAGTTYLEGIHSVDPLEKSGCYRGAIKSLENAISLEPKNTAHRVNLALVHTEHPPESNPMKGIQMLLKLNKEQPESVPVLNTLARLAIRTGQYDKAKVRLEKVLEVEPSNKIAICSLVKVYAEIDDERLGEFRIKCDNLTIKE